MTKKVKISALGLEQLRYLVLLGSTLSVVFSSVYIFSSMFDFQNQLQLQQTSIENMALSTSSIAAWTLDERLALSSLQSLTLLADIEHLRLYDDHGVLLAEIKENRAKPSLFVSMFHRLIAPGYLAAKQKLYIDIGGEFIHAGFLDYKLSAVAMIQKFLGSVGLILCLIFAQTLGTALIVLLYSYKKITRPIDTMIQFFRSWEQEDFLNRPILERTSSFKGEIKALVLSVNHLLTDFYRHQDQLIHLATIDSLTQIYNRNEIFSQLRQLTIVDVQQDQTNDTYGTSQRQIAIIFLDLDRFKHINDSLGHDYGDKLLQVLATRLISLSASKAIVGRLGGDEFLILYEYGQEFDTLELFLQDLMHVIEQPVTILEKTLSTGCSAGVALFPQHDRSVNGLLKCADLAMYSAKKLKQRWAFFSEEMEQLLRKRELIAQRMSQSPLDELFCLYYQPKLDLTLGRYIGCEALLRWKSDEESNSIYDTIVVAEEINAIGCIGQWVFQSVCVQLAKWQLAGLDVHIAFNVSAAQLLDLDFVDKLVLAIEDTKVDPRGLEMEITETMLMADFEKNKAVLQQVRQLGIRISLDDFGTGYSSLAYLADFEFDVLKIDRAFIAKSDKSNSLLATIISIAKTLGLDTVAEGIETQAQKAQLLALGANIHQGFLYSKPVPLRLIEPIFMNQR